MLHAKKGVVHMSNNNTNEPMRKTSKIWKHIKFGIGCFIIYSLLKPQEDVLHTQDMRYLEVNHGDTYFDDFENPEFLVDKFYEAIDNNSNLTEDELKILYQFRKYFQDNIYLNVNDLCKHLQTLEINELDIENQTSQSVIMASYDIDANVCTIYHDGLAVKNIILPHEIFHMTGNMSDYPGLSEGITELLAKEYFANGQIGKYYWINVHCVKILCEFIDPHIILQAYSQDNSQLILDYLTAQCRDETVAKNFLNALENLCTSPQKDSELYQDFLDAYYSILSSLPGDIEQVTWYKTMIDQYLQNEHKSWYLWYQYPEEMKKMYFYHSEEKRMHLTN